MSNRAVIYARFSPRPNAADCLSIEKQFDLCGKFCELHGHPWIAKYSDSEASGKSTCGRPGLESAIQKAIETKGVLVVLELSRLARSTRDAIDIVHKLQKADAQLAIVNLQIDTTTPIGTFFFTIVAAFAQLERETISQRTSEAMLYHQSEGRPMGGVPPFGYYFKDGTLVRCPSEQKAIAIVLQERECGVSFRGIAKVLDETGLACRATKWHASTVRRIWNKHAAGL